MYRDVEVVAHRGASAYVPEHTFAAYDLALEMGADVLELDVRATRDGTLVVLHDRTLARTAGDPRRIDDVAFDELPAAGRPLSLDEVLARYATATRWLVEMKDPTARLTHAVVEAVRAHGLLQHATVQSFDHLALRRVRRMEPRLDVAPLICESSTVAEVLTGIRRAGRYASGVSVAHVTCTAAVILAARARGLRTHAFTVNDAVEMERLIALGVDGLITDCPDHARIAARAATVLARAA